MKKIKIMYNNLRGVNMSEITLENLQKSIAKIDHKNNAIDKYFYKLTEEVGELAKVIRKDKS